MYKWILTTTLIIMTRVRMMVNSVRKWGKSFEWAPTNLEKSSGAKISNVPESLEGGDVGLNFQSNILERW